MHNEQKAWAGTTYGNTWMHQKLVQMLRYVDVRLIYAFVSVFVIPVCLVIRKENKYIYGYFRRQFGYGALKALWKTYVNNCLFGQVVIDRFAMYAGRKFDVEIEGYDNFLSLAARPEGFMHFSAHVGNYELAGYTLEVVNKRMNALVFAGEKASVMENRNRMFAHTNIGMIPMMPDMSHIFAINHALEHGEIVSMPCDRVHGSTKCYRLPFLGGEADFAMGPFAVAASAGYNVLAVNVMKASMLKYRIYVTPLDYDRTQPRRAQMKQLAEAYVSELERIVRMYPTQWYNYFDFWK